MHFFIPLITTAITLASAQTFITSVLLLDSFESGIEPYSFNGELISGDDTELTYVLNCMDNDGSCKANNEDGLTLLQGPSTLSYRKTQLDGSRQKNTCVLSGTTEAVCRIDSSARITVTGTSLSSLMHQVTVTQGASFASVLPGGFPSIASASATTATATGIATSPSGTSASQDTTSLPVAASSTPATMAAASSPSTGGLPRVTGKPQYVLGGAMAAVAAVAGAI